MIQSTRPSSISSLYVCKWRLFEEWFTRAQKIPFQCSVGAIVPFLQGLTDSKILPLKVALWLNLALAKCVSDIQALSLFLCISLLKPKLAFVPNVVGPCLSVDLAALQPLPNCLAAELGLHMLCPICAL